MHLKVTEAAEHLRLSKSTLDKLRCHGGGPTYFKLGRTIVYAVSDLDSWMASRRRSATAVAANDNTATAQAAA
ncbi:MULTISPECIES: helix-turn-helix transcriptional regulator [Bradyrhizobium]|jgi:predicted DNA-binding transcriptional regulator AlpA|uniref:helix-turn-helix transcriptional regulator n=1 Tax=Bradyrhizobium TaxID=374 RepID=UPI0004AF95EA|nr:helix-turn-helix domain-containing protein [Bradyrhizobium japonicum]MCP1764989.1 putative DNA-binding transcriptional regulator AlpA [Bradyrhizobium japonicum]MCP1787126.1 putative DNA-binding transcriptional regulator AlpA [Bradyrhizobium japonicum]MCP1809003.1 putative DNA-binding transcriptional regulator AlpA [Bradyrhizobium japonicum]MCP1817933.1 putative DNA-binding transcriptional regulator AlpA [Bradyrhizobium japonicum]MCP1870556.1 putative DNA-binding transcriptional regulator Al